jgi:hypothetical protein
MSEKESVLTLAIYWRVAAILTSFCNGEVMDGFNSIPPWTFTLEEVLTIRDRARVQRRWEAYNTFNHTQWSGVNNTATFNPHGQQVNSLFRTGHFGARSSHNALGRPVNF